MALLRSQLDVLGIEIASPDNDYLFEASADKQLAVMDEAQVAGAEKWALARSQIGAKGVFRLIRQVAVSISDRGPRQPNFADLIGLALAARLPRRTIGLTALLLVLLALQIGLVWLKIPIVTALHALNAIVLLSLAGWLTWTNWAWRTAAKGQAPAAGAPSTP